MWTSAEDSGGFSNAATKESRSSGIVSFVFADLAVLVLAVAAEKKLIKVSKKDEVHISVDTDPSTAQEICDFFTIEIPGAKFMPLYKKREWDEKTRMKKI